MQKSGYKGHQLLRAHVGEPGYEARVYIEGTMGDILVVGNYCTITRLTGLACTHNSYVFNKEHVVLSSLYWCEGGQYRLIETLPITEKAIVVSKPS